MKEKLKQIKNSINRSNNSKYGFLLSIVALVEIIMIISVSTFSWVETISSIKISNEGKVGTIDTYTFTDALVGVGSDYNKSIDLSDYFRASGNAHLSAASSADGVNFFFPKVANASDSSSSSKYRKGTLNDKNTNYISFSFKVTAQGSNQNFFFNSVPTFYADSEAITDKNDIRVAITVEESNGDKKTRIYSYNAGTTNVVADVDGAFVTESTIYAFNNFTDNTAEEADRMLFSVNKNETKTITVTMWLQDFADTADRNAYSGKKISAPDFKIVTATKRTQITFVDKTSGFNSTTTPIQNTWQWVGNDEAKMWVRTASGSNYEMTKATVADGSAPKWTVSIPTEQMGDDNTDMFFYRTENTVDSDPQNNYLNYWQTKFADNKNVNPVYSAYGSSQNSAKLVYGTWGDLSEIQLYSDKTDVLPTPSSLNALNITQVTLKNSNNIAVEMNFNNKNIDTTFWRAYIPKDDASKNLTFSFNSYNISASNRDTTADVSTYYVTSAATGYWKPPAEVQVYVYSPHTDRGTVSVTGGAENETSVKVTKGTSVTVTATPKADYAFEGWYTDPECTTLASQGNDRSFTFSATSTTYKFYAKFQYNVRLTAVTDNESDTNHGCTVQINEGTKGKNVSAYVKDGKSVTLKAIPNDENYVFDGWYYKNNEQVKDGSDAHIKTPVITIDSLDKPIDYYAHFKVRYFTLKACAVTKGDKGDATGGGVKFNTQTYYSNYATTRVKYTDKATFIASVNEAEGYEFKGWYSDEACTKRVCCDATDACTHTSYEVDKTTPYQGENNPLYAKFELKKYEIKAVATKDASTTESAEGGTVKITVGDKSKGPDSHASLTVTHGSKVKFTAKENNGYKFLGWFDKDGTSVNSKPEFTTDNGVSGSITYYARFSKGTTIYFTDYFAEEKSYNAYAAYLYHGDTKYEGEWPGKLISSDSNGNITTDEETGYCVYTNNTNTSGDFKVVINNNNKGSQYPSKEKEGLSGTFGNIYFFGNDQQSSMSDFNPISVGVNAVTYDENGAKVQDSFSGGNIKVGFNTYSTAKTLKRQSGDTFYATPQPTDGYEFDGWYTDEACSQKVTDSAVTNQKLKIVPTDGTTYYAKFVKSATNKLYLIPNEWTADSARFAAYFMNSDKTVTKWESMTSTGNGYYEVTIPDGDWKFVIFCRMNPDTTDNNWSNKWNQTKDLEIPTNGTNCYSVKVNGNDWDKQEGTWSKH